MVVVATTSKRSTELGDSGIGSTAVDFIKTHKLHVKLHIRFCVVVLLILGVLVTVPTEFFVEVSIISARSADPTESSLPGNTLIAAQSIEETKAANIILTPEETFIQDVLFLPEEVLLLVRLPDRASRFSGKDELTCLFHGNVSTVVRGVEYIQGRATVRCGSSESVVMSETVEVALKDAKTGVEIYPGEGTKGKKWGVLVFELWATEKDVVLFAKGINRRRGTNVNTSELRCVFDGGRYETKVTVSAQEVFRCEHPPVEARQALAGRPATLRWEGLLVETVAYYAEKSGEVAAAGEGRMCACTVIYDVAKFLGEWVMYHAHVGVDKFVFYDNNSDDELDETLTALQSSHLPVTKYPWPWPKTQEAAFSHCALSNRDLCGWTMFTDIDEFLFPASWLNPPPTSSSSAAALPPLRRMISALSSSLAPLPPTATPFDQDFHSQAQQSTPIETPSHLTSPPLHHHHTTHNTHPHIVGQLSFDCHDFGPSGLTQHPPQGVTQGYTCRTRRGQRHKSIVKLGALPNELINVVHHFELRPGYRTLKVDVASAVVNHYKFQAWTEFRRKFRRRVSAYVADWKESKNLNSKDRAPGLGSHAAKPSTWESSFCEVTDTALMEYAHRVFAVNVSNVPRLAWEL